MLSFLIVAFYSANAFLMYCFRLGDFLALYALFTRRTRLIASLTFTFHYFTYVPTPSLRFKVVTSTILVSSLIRLLVALSRSYILLIAYGIVSSLVIFTTMSSSVSTQLYPFIPVGLFRYVGESSTRITYGI